MCPRYWFWYNHDKLPNSVALSSDSESSWTPSYPSHLWTVNIDNSIQPTALCFCSICCLSAILRKRNEKELALLLSCEESLLHFFITKPRIWKLSRLPQLCRVNLLLLSRKTFLPPLENSGKNLEMCLSVPETSISSKIIQPDRLSPEPTSIS